MVARLVGQQHQHAGSTGGEIMDDGDSMHIQKCQTRWIYCTRYTRILWVVGDLVDVLL